MKENPITIRSNEEARSLLGRTLEAAGSAKVAFVSQRASDLLLFKGVVPLDMVISLDYGRDAELIEKELPLISLEKKAGIRKPWYSSKIKEIFEDTDTRTRIKEALPAGSIILPYSSISQLEDVAREEDWRMLSAPSAVREILEDKFLAREIKESLGLPNLHRLVPDPRDLQFEEVTKEFGKPFVVQAAKGSSGSGTFIVKDEPQWLDVLSKFGSEPLLLVPFLNCPVPSMNGVITRHQVILLPPTVTVIGHAETASKDTVFCGTDFAAAASLPPKLIDSLRSAAMKVAEELRRRGFLGAFNLDFLADGDGVLTDINPRFMSSGTLIVEDQIARGETPLSLLHALAFLGTDFVLSPEVLAEIAAPKKGALVVMHSLEPHRVFVNGDLPIGYYSMEKEFLRPGYEYSGLRDGEVLLGGSIPRPGKPVEPESPLVRIYSRERVLDDEFKLLPRYRDLCKWAYAKLDLRP